MFSKIKLLCIAFLLAMSCAYAQTPLYTGAIKGLTVVVELADAPFPEPVDSVDRMMNQLGFAGWGNIGSVRDFYYMQSNGKTTITSTVVKVYVPHTIAYYYEGGGGWDLSDVLDAVNAKYPNGFQGLTIDPVDGSIKHFHILNKAGKGGWAFGPQPGTNTIKNNGVDLKVNHGNITLYSKDAKPDISTICHEMGHSMMNWTDYYQTAFCNLGYFDVMASAGSQKGPMPVNPALRLQRGWINTIINVPGDVTAQYTLTANNYNEIHRYVNPNNQKEYLLFQAIKVGGFYQDVINGMTMPEGLAIWYVDEDSRFNTPGQYDQFFVRLVQADNKDEMHDEDSGDHVHGDYQDLYGNANTSFPNGHPLRWKDGGELGISISSIAKSGNTVTFTVNGRPNTAVASTSIFGTVTPKGAISVPNGASQSFTFTPNIGYALDVLKVDGTVVTASNPYPLPAFTGTKTIQATFKRQTTIPALPSPWLRTDIGTPGATGFAAQASGKFNLESYGGGIGNGTTRDKDTANFVYQTLNGNGTIVARIADFNLPKRTTLVGLMMRASLQSNSQQTMIAKVPFAGVSVFQRNNSGEAIYGDPNGLGAMFVYELYHWLRISRTGNQITSACSRDGVNWTIIGVQNMSLPAQVYVGLFVTGGTAAYPGIALFDNVSVSNTAPCSFAESKISGDVTGTLGSWANSGNTREKAFDNDIFTYFDANVDIAWTGLSLPQAYKVTGIRFVPRRGATSRMIGGKFQGSNSADFSSVVTDLATVTADPSFDWHCIPVSSTATFRYLRYICAAGGVGNVAEIEFYGTPVNAAPTVSITSPANNAAFTAPATVNITASAADSDGSIASVAFYNGTTLLATDNTAPYSYSWTNVASGTYSITARATDNQGAVTTSAAVSISCSNSVADISGPSCGGNNTTLLYTLSAAKQANATSYNWYFTGSAQSITPVAGAPYKANLSTGGSFSTGQVCVGVNYNVSPWYASYCVNVAKCATGRDGYVSLPEDMYAVKCQNPFIEETTLTLGDGSQAARIEVYNSNAVLIRKAEASGSYTFGSDLNAGLYILKIKFNDRTEVLKLIKEQ